MLSFEIKDLSFDQNTILTSGNFFVSGVIMIFSFSKLSTILLHPNLSILKPLCSPFV